MTDGAVTPSVDNDLDLGSAASEYKDLYIDGVGYIDSVNADTLYVGSADIDAGTIDNVTIGGSTAGIGTFTTLTSTSFTATTADIDGGTIDNVTIGGTTAGTGTFTTLTSTSFTTTTADINGGTIDNTAVGNNVAGTGTFTTLIASTSFATTGDATVSGGDVTVGSGATAYPGRVILHDGDGGDAFTITLQANDDISADIILTFPADDGTASQSLVTDGEGNLGWSTVIGNTLDQAYDQGGAGVGRSISADNGAVEITVSDTSNNANLVLSQNDTTNNPVVLQIDNSASGNAIFINQDGVTGVSLNIDSESTTADYGGYQYRDPDHRRCF